MRTSTIRLAFVFLGCVFTGLPASAQRFVMPDSTFGTDGVQKIYDSIYNRPASMDIQPDGKVVIGMMGNYAAIARYHADGSVDTGFGGRGFRAINNYGYCDGVFAVRVLPNGKILASAEEHSGGTYTNFIVRLTATGAIDSNFGTAGITVVSALQYTLSDMKVLSDGSIRYIFYNTATSTSAFSPAVMRLDSNGHIDNVFGTKIVSRIVAGNTNAMYNMDHADRLIIAGRDSNSRWVIGRMLPNGSYDNSFGANGFATITTAGTNALTQSAVSDITTAIEPDNSIVAVMKYSSTYGDIFAAHILAGGMQDMSYGQSGLGAVYTNTNNITIYHNLVGALALSTGDVIIEAHTHYNGVTFQIDKGQLFALSASGFELSAFPGQTDSLLLSYDSPNGLGGEITATSMVQKVPGQNKLMAYATASNINSRFLAKFAFSGFVAGIDEALQAIDFVIYPNPASGICTLHISDDSGEKYSVQIVDMMGKEISAKWECKAGVNTFSIAPYAKGLYTLRVSDSKGVQSSRKLLIE